MCENKIQVKHPVRIFRGQSVKEVVSKRTLKCHTKIAISITRLHTVKVGSNRSTDYQRITNSQDSSAIVNTNKDKVYLHMSVWWTVGLSWKTWLLTARLCSRRKGGKMIPSRTGNVSLNSSSSRKTIYHDKTQFTNILQLKLQQSNIVENYSWTNLLKQYYFCIFLV